MARLRDTVLALLTVAWIAHFAPARAETARVEPRHDHAPDADNQQRFNLEPPLAIFHSAEDALMDPKMSLSWGTHPARNFLAVTTDVGFVYARPRISVGHGRPFTSWVGIDANFIAQTSGLGGYGGVRVEVPHFDIRFGARYFAAFTHTYLAPKTSYDRLDLETSEGNKSRILTYETEADASIPAGPGDVLLRGSLSLVTGIPDDQNVFEETLHVIVRSSLVWRARAGYAVRLGPTSQHSIGLVGEVIEVPKRDDSLTLRFGPVIRLVLSRRVEIRGSFVVTVVSPDRIGLVGGDFTDLGVRYRWATE
jgi:hypothetical protein